MIPTLVLDTNVLVSALINPRGTPAGVLRTIIAGSARLAYDERMHDEYASVLARPTLGLSPVQVGKVLQRITKSGRHVVGRPCPVHLPDLDDEPFLEVALACTHVPLVTGNMRHFPEPARSGVRVVTPTTWLEEHRGGTSA